MCRKFIYSILFLLLALGLAEGQARGAYMAAYWDGNYPTNWAAEPTPTTVRDTLQAAGYEILNANQLKTWMVARIADQVSSVVIFCPDIAPDTVCETNTANCTLRKYLDAGGKIVFYADIPFWNQGNAGGASTNWGASGATGILGFNAASATWDSGNTVTITDAGIEWGLTSTWASARPTAPANVDIVLAQDNAGNAAAWVKHYVSGDEFGGFVRIRDVGGMPNVDDLMRLAEYGLGGNPFARGPVPANGAMHPDTWVSMSWIVGDFAVSHDVYFGDNFDDVNDGTGDTFRGNQDLNLPYFVVGFPGFPYPDGLVPGATYYWRIDEVNDANPNSPWKGNVWSFWIPPKKAYKPVPSNGGKFVNTENLILSWTPGFGSKLHTVYFGNDYDTVANAISGTSTAVTNFKPGLLELEKTYYWRVDEFDAAATHKGDIWSFTTAKAGGGLRAEYYHWGGDFPPPDPFQVFVTSEMVSEINWNWGDPGSPNTLVNVNNFACRFTGEVEAAFTETYTFYMTTDDGQRLWVDGQPIINFWVEQGMTEHSGTIDLVAGQRYSIEVWMYENGGGAGCELRWSSPSTPKQIVPQAALSPPVRAMGPSPANGATGTKMTPILRWGAGVSATSHEVYFGTDADAVANADKSSPEYKGTKAIGDENYDPGKLAWHTSYYWRIDEVNNLNPDSPWIGNLWSFTTGDFIVIDDFEDYNAGENQIWYSWIDGLGYGAQGTGMYNPGNGTGAAVGDETTASYTEETIVHSGSKSMPLAYDNNKQGYSKYSEAELKLTAPRDWTEEGVANLSLWFRGYPASTGSFVEGPVGTYTMTASGADIWAVNGVEADEFHFAYKMLTGAGSIVAKVNSVQNTNDWAKAGVMIRETLDPDSAHAFACVTPASGVAAQGRPSTGGVSVNYNQTGVAAPYWVKLERSISGMFTVSHSANGSTWSPVTGATPQTIPMGANVYIGLALTSHDAALTCQAVLSNVTTTGNVTGQWAHQDIGITSNDAESLYVAVSNSAGTPAVVVNDDPAAAQIDTWTEWVIPLQAFADQGIVLTNVDRIAIGLGTRGNMTVPGGSGKMYFDDIRLYRPAPEPEPEPEPEPAPEP